MSSAHAQFQFGAEFVTLMVAAAGLALLAQREGATGPLGGGPDRPLMRTLTAAGFLATATAAFLHGSLLLSGNPGGAISLTRLAGALALAVVARHWNAGSRSGAFYLAGLAGWVLAAAAELAQASSVVVDVLLVAGSLAVGVALVAASRQAIAARVAAGSATTLLLVIVVLAVALSAVISSSVQRDELKRLSSRAQIEVGAIQTTGVSAQVDARYAALYLGETSGAKSTPVGRALVQAHDVNQGVEFAYGSPGVNTITVAPGTSTEVAGQAARIPALIGPSCTSQGASTVLVAGGSAWAAASYPVCRAPGGSVIALIPLDFQYLTNRTLVDPTVSLALVTPTGVLALGHGGPAQPAASTLTAMAARAGGTRATANEFLAAQAVPAAQGQVAVVLSTSASTVLSTRTQLYRTLFLIALGGTVLALGLATITGDRITAGLRRLTDVAARIERGESSERADIIGDDEVARLGSAFDSMVGSVEEQAVALQAAADDETRLRNRLEAVVAGMNDALIAVDDTGRVTEFNRAAEGLLGLPADSARGRPVADLVDLVGEDGSDLAGRLARATTEPWGEIGAIRGPGDVEVPVAVSSGTLRGPAGDLAGQVVVLRDLRREQEVEQMKTEFLSRIGHELRTPLTGIMGYADILLRRQVTPHQARDWHQEILQAGRRLLRIVEMLEFFASSGAGRVLLRPEPVDTRALVNGLTAAWSERLPDNVKLGRRVARATPAVLADRRWISLALDELIDNAVKFSPDGGRIVVGAAPVPSHNGDPGSVEIFISDRGVGMSAEDSASVFSDFVQGDGSDTRRFGGLGLGLAVVRRVVEGHGGYVSCRSTAGLGTTFTIRLPSPTPDPSQS